MAASFYDLPLEIVREIVFFIPDPKGLGNCLRSCSMFRSSLNDEDKKALYKNFLTKHVKEKRGGTTHTYFTDLKGKKQGEAEIKRKTYREVFFYKDDKREGKVRRYNDGTLLMEKTYENDHLEGEHKSYFKNGIVRRHCFYRKGNIHGKVTLNRNDGTISEIKEYKKGRQVGKEFYLNRKGEIVNTYVVY